MDEELKRMASSGEFQENTTKMTMQIKLALMSAEKSMDKSSCEIVANMNKRMFDAHLEVGFTREEAIRLTANCRLGGK